MVIGGIIGSVLLIPTFFSALSSAGVIQQYCGKKDVKDELIAVGLIDRLSATGLKTKGTNKTDIMYLGTLTAISFGIGVGLAAAIVSIFPGAMLGMQSLALIGAAIGAITPVIATLAMNHAIVPIAEKVDEYIISPMFEKVFSSEEQKKAV
ncbi:MAG: hypothetical protein KTV72_01310 [Wolbachia endosymbiont of Melophagus ovinus]|nr:hypothetical protein [Wolbachia endosymbiont of Melophagus ovinus]